MWWQAVPPLPPPDEDNPEADSPEQENQDQTHLTSVRNKRVRRKFRPGDIVAASIAIALIVFCVTAS